MRAYYNEFDKKAAAWLRELIKAGLITDGDVDERSITEVRASDLVGYDRVHFFAGIGGWELALRLADWPEDRPVWTGSCPCQPFSSAGKQKGVEDERHLWPVFCDLIRKCKPSTVFGEQVASAIGHGWLDGVFADLEAQDYACGAVVLGAHSVGAPHIRQRLYWVADGSGEGLEGHGGLGEKPVSIRREGEEGHACQGGAAGGMGVSEGYGRDARGSESGRSERTAATSSVGGMGISNRAGSQSRDCAAEGDGYGNPVVAASGWADFRVIPCRDGKHRRIPIEPAFFPLADGLPARVVRLRGYGNAIVPQVAAAFIEASY